MAEKHRCVLRRSRVCLCMCLYLCFCLFLCILSVGLSLLLSLSLRALPLSLSLSLTLTLFLSSSLLLSLLLPLFISASLPLPPSLSLLLSLPLSFSSALPLSLFLHMCLYVYSCPVHERLSLVYVHKDPFQRSLSAKSVATAPHRVDPCKSRWHLTIRLFCICVHVFFSLFAYTQVSLRGVYACRGLF